MNTATLPFSEIQPTVVLADTSPLIHLAVVDKLDLLFEFGKVVIADVVELEAAFDVDKPFAREIRTWIEAHGESGDGRIEIGNTELGPLYELALKTGVGRPNNAGERAIVDWLADNIVHAGGPALVIYENGKIPNMLRREGLPEDVVVVTGHYFLRLAQELKLIADAENLRSRIQEFGHRQVQSAGGSDPHSEDHPMDTRVLGILKEYSRGERSAADAASAIGVGTTVGDVFVLTREAGLPPPDPEGPFELAEFEKAKKLFERLRKLPTGRAA